ncbi:MAG: Gfo/Idh/MocA family oxidoreductase [Candidatus Omnitrophica bacterium]|nr:Gfo/Idh/MocA family oxidoreductase [Candidatus Omnitrophota bacterium]
MKIIFFGLGAIGARHAKLIADNYGHQLFAFRSSSDREKNDLDIQEIFDWNSVEKIRPDIAFITNPTGMHMGTALECAKRGMHLFIEKPLSNSMEGVEELEKICDKKGLTAYVAYCMRFHPVMDKLKGLLNGVKVLHVRSVSSSYLPEWRSMSDWRRSYSSNRNMGGGVILDLSHELDYLEYLFSPIKCLSGSCGRMADITVDTEDYADIVFSLENGVKGIMHLNYLSHFKERKLIVDHEDGYIIGDFFNNKVTVCSGKGKNVSVVDPGVNNMYLDQLKYFFDHIGVKGVKSTLNLGDSRDLLKKIVDFKKSCFVL